MRFIVDACTGPRVAKWLREQRHEVYSVHDESPQMEDSQIIQKAISEQWIIITNDKDFGEMIYREKYEHRGVILLRLDDERTGNKMRVIGQLLESYAKQIEGRYIVVTETRIRVARQR